MKERKEARKVFEGKGGEALKAEIAKRAAA